MSETEVPDAQHYFSAHAGQWDDLRRGFFTEQMRDDAIRRAQLPTQATVADVGTGTGFVLAGLVQHAARLVGFDQNEEMLSIAKENLSAYPHVTLRHAEGRRLPAEDESFDAVFANMYLHHAPDPAAAITEMVRLLKPGGRLVITDLDSHDQAWMRRDMADRWLGFERDQIRRWFTGAGLSEVVVDCAAGTCECTRAGEAISLSVFVALGTR